MHLVFSVSETRSTVALSSGIKNMHVEHFPPHSLQGLDESSNTGTQDVETLILLIYFNFLQL